MSLTPPSSNGYLAPMRDEEQSALSSGASDAETVTAESQKPAQERGSALLVSFAMLRVRWDDQNSSYIDNFVPLVAHCVKSSGATAIATQDVQRQLQERFGLAIPQHALSTVIRRGARQGLFRVKHHMLVPDEQALESTNLEPSYQRAQRAYTQLLNKFLTFVKEKYGRNYSEPEVDDAFLAYVTDRAIPIVRLTLLGRGYQPHLGNLGELELMIADFIVHLSQADVEGFDHLDMIVRGCMLATALYLPDPNDQGRKVTDLVVYVDTPIIVELLGLLDDAREEAASELVKLLQDLGARIACFSHTLQETENLLTASSQILSAGSIEGRRVNEIVSYAVSRGLGRTELEMKAATVEDTLHDLGLTVRDAPDYRVQTTCDEKRMEEVLQSVVGYARPETRQYDVKSLAAIWRLRNGHSQRHLESARAIFLTSNESLVRASAEFFGETPNGFEVPVCTLDSQLATVAWLKKPMAAPDLPKRQIVADCIAALEPGKRLWERFLDVVEQTHEAGGVTEEEYATLRYTVSARRALVEETLGDDHALAVGSIPEILRRAKESMTQETQNRLQSESQSRHDAESKADAEARRAAAAEESLRSERDEHQAALQSSDDKQKAELARRIGNKAHRRAVRTARVIYALLALVVIGGAAAGLGLVAGGVATVLVAAAGVLGARHVLVGESVSDLAHRTERFLEMKFEERERKSLGL
jgi:hypothetical protein